MRSATEGVNLRGGKQWRGMCMSERLLRLAKYVSLTFIIALGCGRNVGRAIHADRPLTQPAPSTTTQPSDAGWGAAVNGLQARIVPAKLVVGASEDFELLIELRNVGARQLVVELPAVLPILAQRDTGFYEDPGAENYNSILTAEPLTQTIMFQRMKMQYGKPVSEWTVVRAGERVGITVRKTNCIDLASRSRNTLVLFMRGSRTPSACSFVTRWIRTRTTARPSSSKIPASSGMALC